MQNENARNMIIFVVLTAIILIGYQVFVLQPQMKQRQALEAAQRAAHAQVLPGGVAATPSDALKIEIARPGAGRLRRGWRSTRPR